MASQHLFRTFGALCVFLLFPSIAARADALPAAAPPSLPTPTDQIPPEVLPPSPIPLRGLLVSGAVDARYRTATTGRTDQIWLNTAELDIAHPFTAKNVVKGGFLIQVIAENPPDIPGGRDIQIGEAYFLYKLPIQTDTGSTAYLKAGQFQLPFGLLAVYDPHLLILQPLYAQSLGLRNDFGVEVSGRFYGYLNYDFSLTTGTGPNHLDSSANRVVCFRLGRTFVTRNGTVNVGGSLLTGRLPVTDITLSDPFALELPPSGRVRAGRGERFVPKSRIGGDATLTYKNIQARSEAIIGADEAQRVQGYYAEGDYRFLRRTTVVFAHSLFVYPQGNSSATRTSLGLTYAVDVNLTLRALYENLRDVPQDQSGLIRHRLTAQVLLRF